MSAQSTAGVGAEDFLARYAPNLSRKERSGLTEMVRAAVRDYMTESRLTQPPAPRLLAYMMQQQPRYTAPTADVANQSRRRPATARGRYFGDEEDENLHLVGSATGIRTETPRYALVSPKFAPERQKKSDRKFPETLMGFVDPSGAVEHTEPEVLQDSNQTVENSPENKSAPEPAAGAPAESSSSAAAGAAAAAAAGAASVKRPATANWLTWRGETPFYASDRELRAFRHRQNPRKPMPDELPHVALYRRPGTARGRLQNAEDPAASPVDKGILSWVQEANEQDKQVAYNLLKAIGSNRGGGSGFEGLGINGTAAAAFDLNGQRRLHRRGGPPLPPPEDRHTFGRRTRPPTPQRPLRQSRQSATAGPAGSAYTPPLFAGVEDNYSAARSRVHPARLSADYVHPGSGFTNACPPYRSNFVVHPDWVSEQTAPAPPPRALRRSNPEK